MIYKFDFMIAIQSDLGFIWLRLFEIWSLQFWTEYICYDLVLCDESDIYFWDFFVKYFLKFYVPWIHMMHLDNDKFGYLLDILDVGLFCESKFLLDIFGYGLSILWTRRHIFYDLQFGFRADDCIRFFVWGLFDCCLWTWDYAELVTFLISDSCHNP